MNEELERIRNKDYGQLDDRLFNNLSRTGDLDNTICKLVELQSYLRNQISSIQNQQQKQAAMQASKIVLAPNSFTGTSCSCHHQIVHIQEKLLRLKKSLSHLKDYIKKQHSLYHEDLQEMFRDGFEHIINKYNKKMTQNLKFRRKIQNLEEEIQQLSYQNCRLKKSSPQKNKDDNELISFREMTSFAQTPKKILKTELQKTCKSLKSNHMQTQSFSQLKQDRFYSSKRDQIHFSSHETPRLPMPLRKPSVDSIKKDNQLLEITNNNLCRIMAGDRSSASVDKYYKDSQGRKSTENNYNYIRNNAKICDFAFQDPKSSTKNLFKSQSNSNILGSKQNLMLKRKGADIKEQRKSTKKIKIFSHF